MSDTPAASSLSYSRGAIVGAVTIDQTDHALTIVIRRCTPLMRRAVNVLLLGAVISATWLVLHFWLSRPPTWTEALWIPGLMTGMGFLIASVSTLLASLSSRTIELDRSLTLNCRQN